MKKIISKESFSAGCRQKVTKYHITKLNLQIKADFYYHTLSHLDAVHAVDTSQHFQGIQVHYDLADVCKLGTSTILNLK